MAATLAGIAAAGPSFVSVDIVVFLLGLAALPGVVRCR
jgi:hypothetical protein